MAPLTDFSQIPEVWLARAATRGRYIHEACALDDRGELDEDTLDDRLKPYVEAWRTFRRVTGFVRILSEEPVAHQNPDYAGTIDAWGHSDLDGCILPDIKSGVQSRADRYQLVLYLHAFYQTFPGHSVNCLWDVRLTPQNKIPYRIEPIPVVEWHPLWLAARQLVLDYHKSERGEESEYIYE